MYRIIFYFIIIQRILQRMIRINITVIMHFPTLKQSFRILNSTTIDFTWRMVISSELFDIQKQVAVSISFRTYRIVRQRPKRIYLVSTLIAQYIQSDIPFSTYMHQCR